MSTASSRRKHTRRDKRINVVKASFEAFDDNLRSHLGSIRFCLESDAPLSDRYKLIQAAIDDGAIPILVRLLESSKCNFAVWHSSISLPLVPSHCGRWFVDAFFQTEAAWRLADISTGTTVQAMMITEAGAIPKLIPILQSPILELRENVIRTLGNLARSHVSCRDKLIQMGVLNSIITMLAPAMLYHTRISTVRLLTWVSSTLCGGQPAPEWRFVGDLLVPLTRIAVETRDDNTVMNLCWALSFLCQQDRGRIQYVLKSGVVARVVSLVYHAEAVIQIAALQLCACVTSVHNDQIRTTLASGLLQSLVSVIHRPSDAVRVHILWVFSNVTRGSRTQIKQAIAAGIMPAVISILETDETACVRHAADAAANIAIFGNDDQVDWLGCSGALEAMIAALRRSGGDPRTALVLLRAIRAILRVGRKRALRGACRGEHSPCALLEACGGLDVIENCQTAPQQEIYDLAFDIITTYFEVDEFSSRWESVRLPPI